MSTKKNWLLAGCATALVMSVVPAFAQAQPARPNGPAADKDKEEGTLIDELVVTTERRAQNIEDVPIAITAFTDKTRENIGISTIQDLAQFTPGLSYNAANDRPTIRGVGRQNNNHGLNSPVANYIDGVYTSSVQDTSRRPIFIDRTEILRGPQGALSGRGSAAGAIYTYTKRPRKTFEAEAGGFVNNFNRWGLEGTITGPITDSVRYRLNMARYVQDEGFFVNAEDGHTEGDRFGNRQLFDALLEGNIGKLDWFVKGSAVAYDESLHDGGTFAPVISGSNICQPIAFTGGLVPSNTVGYFSAGPSTACGSVIANGVPFDPQATIYGAGIKQNPVFTNGKSALRRFINNYASDLHLDGYYNLTGDATWHLPGADLRYIVGRARYTYTQSSDADGSAVNEYNLQPLFLGGPSRRVNANGVNTYREAPSWYSNEVTLTSSGDHTVNWIVGLYQFNQYTRQSPQTLQYGGFAELNTPLSQSTFAPVQANVHPFAAQWGQQNTDQDTAAVFGQLDWKPNDKWEISGGLRYNTDKEVAMEQTRLISNSFVGGANGMNSTFSAISPIALDVSASVVPGFALVNPATAVLEPGYRLVDVTSMTTTGAVTVACPGGVYRNVGGLALACASAGNSAALLGPGVDAIPTVNPITGNRERTEHGKWQALTGSIGINYSPNEDTLIYVRYAKGYRPGGFGSGTAGYLPLNPYTDKELLDSYETGTKFTLWNKLQMNVSAFFYDYHDIQAGLTRFERCTTPGDLSTCVPTGVTVNLPSATNKGIEVEGLWFATNDLQIVVSYGYLDAKIKDGKYGLGFEDSSDPAALLPTAQRLNSVNCGVASATCVGGKALDSITLLPRFTQDLSGNQLPNAPHHKIAANANYTWHFNPGTVTASYSYIWRSEAQSDLFNSPLQVTDAYSQQNARIVFRAKDSGTSVIIFAQNLFDQDTFESGSRTRRGNGFTAAQQAANGGAIVAQSTTYYQN